MRLRSASSGRFPACGMDRRVSPHYARRGIQTRRRGPPTCDAGCCRRAGAARGLRARPECARGESGVRSAGSGKGPPNKAFIGRIEKASDFLSYHVSHRILTVAAQTWMRYPEQRRRRYARTPGHLAVSRRGASSRAGLAKVGACVNWSATCAGNLWWLAILSLETLIRGRRSRSNSLSR